VKIMHTADAEKLIEALDFKKGGGLIPVIAQNHRGGEVLMLAFADEQAVRKTIEEGFAHYHSRSRGELWKKGASSGHLQKIVEVRMDCDGDSLLYIVEQTGAACHTGYFSCFFRRCEEGGLTVVGKKVDKG